MKKWFCVLSVIIILAVYVCAQADQNEFDYHVLETSPDFKKTEGSDSWNYNHYFYIPSKDDSSVIYDISFMYSGSESRANVYQAPMILFSRMPAYDSSFESISIAVDSNPHRMNQLHISPDQV